MHFVTTADGTGLPIDASSRGADKGLAGCTLVEYEGAPRGLFATYKDRVNTDLAEFLAR